MFSFRAPNQACLGVLCRMGSALPVTDLRGKYIFVHEAGIRFSKYSQLADWRPMYLCVQCTYTSTSYLSIINIALYRPTVKVRASERLHFGIPNQICTHVRTSLVHSFPHECETICRHWKSRLHSGPLGFSFGVYVDQPYWKPIKIDDIIGCENYRTRFLNRVLQQISTETENIKIQIRWRSFAVCDDYDRYLLCRKVVLVSTWCISDMVYEAEQSST
ncbi:hypothetical protein BDZ91DRAFT_724603 [Kalaharituber pfeilii]|nr:hypothetical protein BDZ91DRAFT_724603 [Kalaharituber pfeilii]